MGILLDEGGVICLPKVFLMKTVGFKNTFVFLVDIIFQGWTTTKPTNYIQ